MPPHFRLNICSFDLSALSLPFPRLSFSSCRCFPLRQFALTLSLLPFCSLGIQFLRFPRPGPVQLIEIVFLVYTSFPLFSLPFLSRSGQFIRSDIFVHLRSTLSPFFGPDSIPIFFLFPDHTLNFTLAAGSRSFLSLQFTVPPQSSQIVSSQP